MDTCAPEKRPACASELWLVKQSGTQGVDPRKDIIGCRLCIEGAHGRNSLSDLPRGFSYVRLELPQVMHHCLATYVLGWDNFRRLPLLQIRDRGRHVVGSIVSLSSTLSSRRVSVRPPHMLRQRSQFPGSCTNKPRISERRHDLAIRGIAGNPGPHLTRGVDIFGETAKGGHCGNATLASGTVTSPLRGNGGGRPASRAFEGSFLWPRGCEPLALSDNL